MNLETYRSWFIVVSLALVLLASAPTLALLVHIPSGSERFSEFWLLDSNHKTDDYPFNVTVGQTYQVYLGVKNHLGNSAYYRVYTKLGNRTQLLPVSVNAPPSPLPPLYQSDFILRDGDVWETQITFKILDVELRNNTLVIDDFSINNVTFAVNSYSTRDSDVNGYYYQFFSELWFYNVTDQAFQYHNRVVQLWLNVTI